MASGDPARAQRMQTAMNQPVVKGLLAAQESPVYTGTVDRTPPAVQAAAPGNPARANQMAAQFNQPVYKGAALPNETAPAVAPTGNPARAARMQSAMSQPVVNESQSGAMGNYASGLAKTLAGGLAAAPAVIVDGARSGVTGLLGGDPNTLAGGPTALQDKAFGLLSAGTGELGQAGSQLAGAGLSLLGAQPAKPVPEQVASVPKPPKAVPAVANGTQAVPSAVPLAQQGAQPEQQPQGNGWQKTDIPGVVGQRGDNGRLKFSDYPEAVNGATGQLDYKGAAAGRTGGERTGGGLSIVSGGAEAKAINDRMVAETRAYWDAQNTGNQLTIVGDSGHGFAEDRRLAAKRQARYGTDGNQGMQTQTRGGSPRQGLAAGNPQKDQVELQKAQQELTQGKLGLAAAQRMADLQGQLMNPNLDAGRRAQIQQTISMLSTPAKDRYQQLDIVDGTDDLTGKQITHKGLYDVVTGQMVQPGQAQPAQPQTPQYSEAEKKAADVQSQLYLKQNPNELQTINNYRAARGLPPLEKPKNVL